MRTVRLVAAPTSAGAYAPGQEDGPRALLDAGLVQRLETAGVAVNRGKEVSRFRWRPDPHSPRAANIAAVIDRAGQVAALVRSAPPEETILVLGGDCTVGVATVAGLQQRFERLGLIYVDRHADLNVPDSTADGALDWMGVAHMLDIGGTVSGLAALAGDRPMLSSGQISFLGLGPHTDFEAEVIAGRRLPVVDVMNMASDPLRSAKAALSPLAACDGLAVHFDVDLVDFLDAPLAENTDRGIAPSLAACGEALSELLRETRVRALTVTEFNPHHGSDDGETTQRLVEVLVNVLSDSE
ncbi:MAG: arginase family protein [Solirubrobacterales bacterium]|nr:arginase family protein [Solirubrobacterales bacterium]MBV9535523.1 arginase family protein [Solirubrobacterales bacterium]